MRKLIITTVALAALAWVQGPTASASTIEHGRFDDHFVDVREDVCGGLTMVVEGDDRGRYSLRLGGPDQLPRFSSTHHGGASFTNAATGLALTATWHYSNQDVHVTDNGDGTLSVVYQVPGPERIYGPDGQQLNISTGSMRLEATIDHGGTLQDPYDDVFLGEEFLVGHGYPPQPPFDFCDAFRSLTAP